ncbi:hypothetical protein D3C84_541750 [compost metagenome]
MGDLAGDHVGFVAVGHRDQHVGVIGARLTEHGRQRAAPLHRPNVEAITEVAQAFAVGVDHGDVIRFAGQVFCQRTANLTCAEDDDLHPVTPLKPFSRVWRRS